LRQVNRLPLCAPRASTNKNSGVLLYEIDAKTGLAKFLHRRRAAREHDFSLPDLKPAPGIYVSPVKEPRFFRTNKRRSEKQYLALFRGAKKAAAMEEHSDAFYYEHVRRYFDVFGTDRVKVIVFEELVQNPRQTVAG
jgi:hypothetical protein